MRLQSILILILLQLLVFNGYAQNRHTIDSLKTLISNAQADTIKVRLLNTLAYHYNEINRDTSIFYLNNALKLSRELNNPKFKAMTMVSLGTNYCFQGDYFKSLEYLDLAENILAEYPEKSISANAFYYKSVVYLSINKLDQASETANEAMALFKETGNMAMVCAAYNLISNIYRQLGDLQKSLDFARLEYKHVIQLGDTNELAGTLNNLGTRYYSVGQLDSAYYLIRQAIPINIKYNNKIWLAINYHNLAQFKLETEEFDSANYYIQLASDIYQESDYLINYYSAIELEAKIALANGDTLAAIEYYNRIIESDEELESLKVKVNAYKALFEIAQLQNRKDDALSFSQSYKIFDDSLKKETNTSLLTVLEMQMEYENHKNQMELTYQEVEFISKRKSLYLVLLAGAFLVLIILAYLFYRLQRAKTAAAELSKQKLEAELEYKNREMTANVMSLLKKNEILSGISKKLLEIEEGAIKQETKDAISKISEEIRKSRNVELWKEFDIRFREVHQDFYEKLLKNYPALTPNEQRVCAFLKLNMSTKDIAELTGHDTRTVENNRYKVRKKLKLDSKTNLISFLSKL